jgi:hypothetical protein
VFYTYFYNHARRLRLERALYLELSRSPNGFCINKPLLDPGGGCTSEITVRRFQKRSGRYEIVSELKRPQIYNGLMHRQFSNGYKCPFVCNGYATAVAAGQSQRFYSILVWESLTGIISVRLLRSCVVERPTLNQGGWFIMLMKGRKKWF